MRKQYDFKIKGAKVFAACNEITRLSKPLQSRFRRLHLPSYSEEQFLEVSVKVLPKMKIAHVIGKAVWEQRGDIHDVISIGKLVRKNDGPEEVQQILRTSYCYDVPGGMSWCPGPCCDASYRTHPSFHHLTNITSLFPHPLMTVYIS